MDTSVVINYIKGSPSAKSTNPFVDCKVSFITLGELMFGAESSKHTNENRNRYIDFCNNVGIINFDLPTAIEYGKIKSELKAKGTPIPENDVWLSAIARAHDMEFVTYDRHFEKVSDLNLKLLELQ